MGFPSAPHNPPPPPAPFQSVNQNVDAAQAAEKQKSLAMANMGGTLVTGGQGVMSPAPSVTKTLLGA